MSKIGKKSIAIPDKVEVKLSGSVLSAKGPKGELSLDIHPSALIEIKDKEIKVSVKNPLEPLDKALWGTFRSLAQNLVTGVSEGYQRKLEIVGVGFRAEKAGDKLILNVGFSHPVEFLVPKELEVSVEKNIIIISGVDKQAVGQFAAKVRAVRKPEPYKGKGIKYDDEVVRRKAGKVVKAAGGAA